MRRLVATGNRRLFAGSILFYRGQGQVRYWREAKDFFHAALKQVFLAFDGTRVGGRDFLFSVLWSPEVGKALWLPPQAQPLAGRPDRRASNEQTLVTNVIEHFRTFPHISAHVRTCPHISAHWRTMAAKICAHWPAKACPDLYLSLWRTREHLEKGNHTRKLMYCKN